MSVLDIDERIEQADKQADLYLRWKAEDDEFQKKHPGSAIYSWFADHSKNWKPEPQIEVFVDPKTNKEYTELEQLYGKPHIALGPGMPVFLMTYICDPANMVDLKTPGLPPASPAKSLTMFSKAMQLSSTNVTMDCPVLRFPDIIVLKNVTIWPDWLIDSRTRRCRQPWDNVTFWVEDSCHTKPIDQLIYRPGISYGDPVGYNFFRSSDYFLGF